MVEYLERAGKHRQGSDAGMAGSVPQSPSE